MALLPLRLATVSWVRAVGRKRPGQGTVRALRSGVRLATRDSQPAGFGGSVMRWHAVATATYEGVVTGRSREAAYAAAEATNGGAPLDLVGVDIDLTLCRKPCTVCAAEALNQQVSGDDHA